ncbi:hypothetical protein TSUD_26170 [Trifolium subterraneum]|uniref:Myb/SANT-like domain-containing protein n=1 Tax=Trifolium subterraneum TaxID=3900 RepID=A0A2Z6NXY1_TRISU|nr:hypothetical protein TSUD_26170 [Trifolium subterraneum]
MEGKLKRPRKSKGLETCNWTTAMDEVLIDAYLHQQTLGNKNGNSMTTSAMDNILAELKKYFPDKPISKDKIKDHMKHIKTKFNACYDLFKIGLSGFAWDAKTNMWIAEPEVWDKLIEELVVPYNCTIGQTEKVKPLFKGYNCPFYNGNFANVSMSFSTHINMPKKELMTSDLH